MIRQKFNKDRSERTLTEVSLADGDVSVVTYPAYPTTSVEAREHLARAIQAVKEGREISGESLVVLQSVFEKMSEGHEYVMEAVEMMAALMGAQEEPVEDEAAVHEDEDELEDIMETEAATPRSISLRLAKALVNSTK